MRLLKAYLRDFMIDSVISALNKRVTPRLTAIDAKAIRTGQEIKNNL